jgi:O-antigen/teichoic acid export membrane protein
MFNRLASSLFGSSSVVAVIRLHTSAMSIFVTMIMTRTMTISDFATIGVIISVNAAVSASANLGFGQAIIKVANPNNDQWYGSEQQIFVLGCLASVVTSAGIAVAIPYVTAHMGWKFSTEFYYELGVLLVSSSISYFMSERLRSRNEVVLAACIGVYGTYGGLVQTLVLTLLLLWQGKSGPIDLNVALVSQIVSAASCAVYLGWILRRDFEVPQKGTHRAIIPISRLASLCLSNASSGIVIALRGQIILWIGSWVLAAEELAQFIAASRIAAIFSIPANIMSFSITYHLISNSAGTKSQDVSEVRDLATLVSWLTLPTILFIFIFHRQTMGIVFGDGYTTASLSVALLAFVNFSQIVMGGGNQVMQLNDAHQLHLIIASTTTLLGAAIAIPLCHQFGANGLGWASVCTILTYYALISFATQRLKLPVTWARMSPSYGKKAGDATG